MWSSTCTQATCSGVTPRPGIRGFYEFCKAVGLPLEEFQRRIARTILGEQPEALVLVSRGQGKSRLLGTIAVWHLLTEPRAACYVAASSREQASVIFGYARDVARHPALADLLTVRHLELRAEDGGFLRVLASDAPKLHGLTPSLCLVDELHAHKDGEVYIALRTALMKRPGARMLTVSTAGTGVDTPLGRLRARALAQPHVTRAGALTTARGPSLVMLEWAVAEDGDVDDPRQVKAANPASWLTLDALREQRAAVPDLAFRRYHCGQWNAAESAVFPPGAWQACAGDATIEDGARIWVGIDAGKGASDSAILWVDEHLNVGCRILEGTGPAHAIADTVDELARRFAIREIVCDPWHVVGFLSETWEQRGLTVVEYPQFDSRLVPATDRLHRAVTERRLTHPDDPQLNAHLAGSMLRDTRRGVRIDKRPGCNNDGMIALLCAIDRAEQPQHPAMFLGWA